MRILTHRGLDPSRNKYFTESSAEAFADQLSRGYGLEFDVQPTKDGDFVVIHDLNLKRISGSEDQRKIDEITAAEILNMEFNGCHLTTLGDLLQLIEKNQSKEALSAIHLKNNVQKPHYLDSILNHLKDIDTDAFIIFDVTLEIARYLKEHNSKLKLASSVSHPYDIKRYNSAVGGTLLSIDEALLNRELFDWVWLDEWDLSDENGGIKKFYTEETFSRFHTAGLKIALVTPELHHISPGLLGGETHPDAETMELLGKRLHEIIELAPNAICTDYPDLVRKLSLV